MKNCWETRLFYFLMAAFSSFFFNNYSEKHIKQREKQVVVQSFMTKNGDGNDDNNK